MLIAFAFMSSASKPGTARPSSKKVKAYIKLEIEAGKATPAPPIGSALGSQKVNIMEFCKAFNAQTASCESGARMPVKITVYVDNSFTFVVHKPHVIWFLKKYAKVSKGAKTTGRDSCGDIHIDDIRLIAQEKMEDLNAFTIEAAMKTIEGSARSMGLKVIYKAQGALGHSEAAA